MTEKDYKEGYHNRHTVKVGIDGVEHPVAILYLAELKKKLGKRITVAKDQESKASKYLAEEKKAKEEAKKLEEAYKKKANTVKPGKKDDLS